MIVTRCCSGVSYNQFLPHFRSHALLVKFHLPRVTGTHVHVHQNTYRWWFYRIRDIDKQMVFTCSFFFAPQQSNTSSEYLTGIKKGKGKHVVWCNLTYVVCHYAEQQGVLIYYCSQWSTKSWRCAEREQIPFFIPTLPTSLHHVLALLTLYFLVDFAHTVFIF